MWFYESPVGLMVIQPTADGRYALKIGDERCKAYHSPKAAADDVYTFSTGCDCWDNLFSSATPPDGLDQWIFAQR